jgi:pimeloyl-ACP methyl ester carboxylesterase
MAFVRNATLRVAVKSIQVASSMNDISESSPLETGKLPAAGHAFDYLDIGSGEPVVFLHGALGDLRTFAPHCRLLSATNRAITYTQRYFGRGQASQEGPAFGIETHAVDLFAVLEALGVGPVNLVAWSYAGHAALRAAQLRPDLLKAVLIYESGFQT